MKITSALINKHLRYKAGTVKCRDNLWIETGQGKLRLVNFRFLWKRNGVQHYRHIASIGSEATPKQVREADEKYQEMYRNLRQKLPPTDTEELERKAEDEIVNTDCVHFNGYKPCNPHKTKGLFCDGCDEYVPVDTNILIIKLQAAGEVLRNTPLLTRLSSDFPNSRIYWLTKFPELVPDHFVYKVLPFSIESITILMDLHFDIVYSLDKDLDACSLANQISANRKKGFTQKMGAIHPFDEDARNKWLTGIHDGLMKKNKQHYLQEIFEICGFKFSEESYVLPNYSIPNIAFQSDSKRIALNTGAGRAWIPRLYSNNRWIELALRLKERGFTVVLVGGPSEDENNQNIAKESGSEYFGVFSYREFIGLLSLFDLIVTSVSFAFHVGVGLKKKLILLNNVFNKSEFYMYGNGVILEPDLPCVMCYKNDFDSTCLADNCMDLIAPGAIEKEALRLICDD